MPDGPVDVGIVASGRNACPTACAVVPSRPGSIRLDRDRHLLALRDSADRIGRDLRIGFNVDHYERTSDVALRAYDGLRYGAVATYGR